MGVGPLYIAIAAATHYGWRVTRLSAKIPVISAKTTHRYVRRIYLYNLMLPKIC